MTRFNNKFLVAIFFSLLSVPSFASSLGNAVADTMTLAVSGGGGAMALSRHEEANALQALADKSANSDDALVLRMSRYLTALAGYVQAASFANGMAIILTNMMAVRDNGNPRVLSIGAYLKAPAFFLPGLATICSHLADLNLAFLRPETRNTDEFKRLELRLRRDVSIDTLMFSLAALKQLIFQ